MARNVKLLLTESVDTLGIVGRDKREPRCFANGSAYI